MKILVIQTGDAASVLLATPLIRCIRKQLPQAELHCLVLHAHAHLLTANPYINQLHPLYFNSHTTVAELKAEAFDHVINLAEDATAKAIVDELQTPLLLHHQKGFKAFLNRLFSSNKLLHPADRYLQQAAALGVVNDGAGLDYFIPRAAEVPFADIPASHSAGFMALAVTAPANQVLPLAAWQQLVAAIQHPVILIGRDEDRALAEKIKETDDVKVYNACGKFTQPEMADLVRKARLLVAQDAYFVQTGAALNKEIVWLKNAATPAAAPYYNSRFLKQSTAPLFDEVKMPHTLFAPVKEKPLNKETAQLVNDVAACVIRRLKPKTKTQIQ